MKSLLLASALLAATATVSLAQSAPSSYGATHPRIHEVNSRLRHQDQRIDRALADGKVSAQRAGVLHAEDAAIKSEEQTDKSLDKGHITKVDQHALNQQLNTVSRQIGGPDHPRLHEVNARLRAQSARIDRAEAAGKITQASATQFHADDAAVKSQETTEKSLDNGHITRAEERALNQQVSSIGHEIGSAARSGASASAGASAGAGSSGAHAGSHGGSHK